MARRHSQYPNLILVQLPTHASWRNQRERCCSIVQRTVLTPNDFPVRTAIATRLRDFAARYNDTAVPFHWRCTRADLADRLAALPDLPPPRPSGPDTGPIAAYPYTLLCNGALRAALHKYL